MNEVTNRQVLIVNDTNTVAIKKYQGMNKVNFLYTELNGKKFTTDTIQMGQIRHIRISRPSGAVFKKWEFAVPAASVLVSANQGKNFQVYMHFKDFMGYDQYHEKFASITLTNKIINAGTTNYDIYDPSDGTTQTVTSATEAFAYEMKKRINAQYINGQRPVIATINASGKIELTENMENQYPTRRKMERRIFPAPCNMYITTNILEGEDDSWSADVAAAGNRLQGVANVTMNNSYLIWRMERIATLDRNEMTLPDVHDPFIPTELVMDSEVFQTSAAAGNDYYVLDIAYWTQPKDVHAAVNNKEITFCSATLSDLTAIATELGTQIGSASTLAVDAAPIVYEPNITFCSDTISDPTDIETEP